MAAVAGPVNVNVVVVPTRFGAAHLARRFATLTDPNPVARSYPGAALNAGVVPPLTVAMAPNWFAAVLTLLQFAVFATHATDTFPFATPFKTQAFGRVFPVELQTLAAVFANPYKT